MSKFQTSSSTATPIPQIKESVHFQNGISFDQGESNFWSKKFALGSSGQENSKESDILLGKPNYDAKHIILSTKSNFAVHSIAFRPAPPTTTKQKVGSNKQMAIASGPRVSLYSLTDIKPQAQPTRNISLSDVAYCTDYRADGRLLAIGAANGSIQVVDVNTRATLRTYQSQISSNALSNKKATTTTTTTTTTMGIRSILWTRDGKKIVSGGDDAILRIWDLGAEDTTKPIQEFIGHADAIRVCRLAKIHLHSKKTTNVVVTGSYDHTLRLWDLSSLSNMETNNDEDDIQSSDICLTVMDHGAPVEDVIIVPTKVSTPQKEKNLYVLSCGGTKIKLWNAITGTLITTVENHAKTITSLCLVTSEQYRKSSLLEDDDESTDESKPRLISGGLDGLIRIYSFSMKGLSNNPNNNNIVTPIHGIKYASPITAIHMTPDGTRMIFGTSDGKISIFIRSKAQEMHEKNRLQMQEKKRKMISPPGGTYSYFMRGADSMPEPDDFVVFTNKKKKLKKFDVALRQFRYSDALDEALGTKNPLVVRTMKSLIIYLLV